MFEGKYIFIWWRKYNTILNILVPTHQVFTSTKGHYYQLYFVVEIKLEVYTNKRITLTVFYDIK